MSTFKTTKGTVLPMRDIRGNDYLDVKYRVVWFREDHPDWAIETELISVTDNSAYAKATIRDEKGRIITTSHKFENVQGFPDFIEKCETGAIGRALALIGYGTQFCADDLDEGKRIVDSPVEPRTQAASKPSPPTASKQISKTPDALKDEDYGEYVCNFGKHANKKIKDFGQNDLDSFVKWLLKQSNRSPSAEIFIDKAEAYLMSLEFERKPR